VDKRQCLPLFDVVIAMKQRAAERERLKKEREERKQMLEQEKLVLPLIFHFFSFLA